MTRGCGMKCEFCAVQTLEPEYYPYISIKDTIKRVDEEFGPKKDLLLMDNNVLRSPNFDAIIDEIIELGFGKGAQFKHPKTGRMVPRYVDFNQGLDAFLLTEHKAKRLGELAIRPARIAFDHIEDKDAYVKAIKLCAKNDIDHMSNYLLYNGEDFKGKGHSYQADTPEDLYERMHISMELQEELSEETGHKVAIFSFPMRYIPLSDLERGFVGTNWNKKYLRALQRMLIPTQGKGVSSRSFFEADFGKNSEEFLRYLSMPEEHLGYRGLFIPKKNESEEEKSVRYNIWKENQLYLKEWDRLFESLSDKSAFIQLIEDNKFSADKLVRVEDPISKKLYTHYLTKTGLLKVFINCDEVTKQIIRNYIYDEFSVMYKRISAHVFNTRVHQSLITGLVSEFKDVFIRDMLSMIDFNSEEHYLIKALAKAQKELNVHYFNFELIKGFYMFCKMNVFDKEKKDEIINDIIELREEKTRRQLLNSFDKFKKAVIKTVANDQVGVDFIIQKVEQQLSEVYKQLSIFNM